MRTMCSQPVIPAATSCSSAACSETIAPSRSPRRCRATSPRVTRPMRDRPRRAFLDQILGRSTRSCLLGAAPREQACAPAGTGAPRAAAGSAARRSARCSATPGRAGCAAAATSPRIEVDVARGLRGEHVRQVEPRRQRLLGGLELDARLVGAAGDQPGEVAAAGAHAELRDDVVALERIAQEQVRVADHVAPLAEVVQRRQPVGLADVDLPARAGAVVAQRREAGLERAARVAPVAVHVRRDADRRLREADQVRIAEPVRDRLQPRCRARRPRRVAAARGGRVADLLRQREAHAHRLAALERSAHQLGLQRRARARGRRTRGPRRSSTARRSGAGRRAGTGSHRARRSRGRAASAASTAPRAACAFSVPNGLRTPITPSSFSAAGSASSSRPRRSSASMRRRSQSTPRRRAGAARRGRRRSPPRRAGRRTRARSPACASRSRWPAASHGP